MIHFLQLWGVTPYAKISKDNAGRGSCNPNGLQSASCAAPNGLAPETISALDEACASDDSVFGIHHQFKILQKENDKEYPRSPPN